MRYTITLLLKRKRILIAVLLTALVAAGLWTWHVRAASSTPQAAYESVAVTRGPIQAVVSATGSIDAVTRVTVGSQVSGQIQEINVDFNSRVQAGEVLARIDPSLLQSQLDQSRASMTNAMASRDNALANVSNALAGIRTAQAGVATARARVETQRAAVSNARAGLHSAQANAEKAKAEKAKAEADNALRNLERIETLLKKDLISRSERDTAHTQALVAQAGVSGAQAQVEAAQATLRSSQANEDASRTEVEAAHIKQEAAAASHQGSLAQVRAAEAQLSQATANVQSATVNLDRTIIRSPIDGIILARNVSVGQTVAAQLQAPDLFTLARNLDRRRLF